MFYTDEKDRPGEQSVYPDAEYEVMETVYEERKGGYTMLVREDDDPVYPRDVDSFGHVILFDRSLAGDFHTYPSEEAFLKAMEIRAFHPVVNQAGTGTRWLSPEGRSDVYLQLFLRGGELTLRHGSRPVGYAYVTKEELVERFGSLTKDAFREAYDTLKEEVQLLSDYNAGRNYVYDIVQDDSGKVMDGGFFLGNIPDLSRFAWRDFAPLREKEAVR